MTNARQASPRQFLRKIRKACTRFVWRLRRGTRQTTKRVRPKKTEQAQVEAVAVKPKPDWWESRDILHNVDRIHKILASGIFDPENIENPLVKSAFTELMICLRDLMEKAETFAERISFTDDIEITVEVYDVTQLIKFVRDALCHIGIYNHFIIPNRIKASFNAIWGKGEMPLGHPDREPEFILKSEYVDDVCFFFGLHRIYLYRHIKRAFDAAQVTLGPLLYLPQPPDIVRY